MSELPAPADLTEAQKDGLACLFCGRPSSDIDAMRPVGRIGRSQVFACEPACRQDGPVTALPVPTPAELAADAKARVAAGDYSIPEWEVCFHEAGHVVAEVASGFGMPDRVFLNDQPEPGCDADVAGRVETRTFITVSAKRSQAIRFGDEVTAEQRAEIAAYYDRQRDAAVVTWLAGEAAETIAVGGVLDPEDAAVWVENWDPAEDDPGEYLDATTDQLAAAEAMPHHVDWWDEQVAWMADRYRDADRLLRANWGKVEQLAAHLHQDRDLNRDFLVPFFEQEDRP